MKKGKIATLMISALMMITLISAFQAAPVSAQEPEITIDGELSLGEWDDYFWFTDSEGNEVFGGVPEFTYYKTNDDDYLYIATIVNDPTPLGEANDDIWLAFRLDVGDDYKVFRKGYKTDPSEYGQLSETGAYGAYGPLPECVEFGWSIDESHVYYEWKIPLELLGVNPSETIKYLTHVREWPVKGLNYHPEIKYNENRYWPYVDITQFGDLTLEPYIAVQVLLEEIEGLNAEIAELEGQLEESGAEIASLNAQIAVLQDRIDELETLEIVDLEGQIESLNAGLDDMQNQIDELNAQLGSKSATIARLWSERNKLEKDLKYWKNQPPSTRIITTGGIGEDGGQMVFAVALGAVGIAAMLCVKSFTTKPKSKKG